jgi:Zn-dependent peptidase ImmA (M78 family)
MARDVRTRLRIGSGPIENLRTLLEKQGIYVFMLPLPKGELSGCSRWDERYAPAILVNARDDSGRRNFSMAHEYYHLLVHPKEAHGCGVEITAEPGEERSANRFAATFLMTREGLAAALRERERRGHPRRAKDYAPLAADWHVSAQALLYALKDFGLMPPQEADRLIDEWATLKLPLRWPKGKPRPTLWDRYVQQLGEPYTHAALAAYREGHISLSKLAHYLGIDIRKARKATEESR